MAILVSFFEKITPIFDDNSKNKNRKFFLFTSSFDSEHCAPFTMKKRWGHFWRGGGACMSFFVPQPIYQSENRKYNLICVDLTKIMQKSQSRTVSVAPLVPAICHFPSLSKKKDGKLKKKAAVKKEKKWGAGGAIVRYYYIDIGCAILYRGATSCKRSEPRNFLRVKTRYNHH